MTKYILGADIGGTKTHVLVADDAGRALGFARGGPGNWEGVGYDGLTSVLLATSRQALEMAKITIKQIAVAGMGIGGYDWPSQRQNHLDAIRPLGLNCPLEIVNDATLGILAGSADGWGVSVVAGTGCNARGWSKDHRHEGRAVGGGSYWSGEYAGGYDIIYRAMRAVAFEWLKRGPSTALSQIFLQSTGAENLDDLVEGVYLGQYYFDSSMVLRIFKAAKDGDSQALEVVRWAGSELGQMAVGIINQLNLQKETFDVVLIGSLYDGHPLLAGSLHKTVRKVAPGARLVRLTVPPVVGGVLLGMEKARINGHALRDELIRTTKELLEDIAEKE